MPETGSLSMTVGGISGLDFSGSEIIPHDASISQILVSPLDIVGVSDGIARPPQPTGIDLPPGHGLVVGDVVAFNWPDEGVGAGFQHSAEITGFSGDTIIAWENEIGDVMPATPAGNTIFVLSEFEFQVGGINGLKFQLLAVKSEGDCSFELWDSGRQRVIRTLAPNKSWHWKADSGMLNAFGTGGGISLVRIRVLQQQAVPFAVFFGLLYNS